MAPFLNSDFEALLRDHQAPCVSIYLPTHREEAGGKQDLLRAKRLLRRAETRLKSGGLDEERAKQLLRPLRRQFSRSAFPFEPGGLATFCSADYCGTFLVPLDFPERLEVGERFYVKPLLPLTEGTSAGQRPGAKPRGSAARAVAPRPRVQRRAARRFAELAGTGQASNDLAEVLEAAHQGRIDILFLDGEADLWGRFDQPGGRVQLHPAAEPGDEELLDAAAALTLVRGGTAYSMAHGEVPGGGMLAAVFRD